MNTHNIIWNYPNSIRLGVGRAHEIPQICLELGITRPLLITDPTLTEMSMVRQAIDDCRQLLGNCGHFDRIKGNPTGRNVDDGVHAYRDGRHDGIIAFGGGSAMDAAKAVALMVGQERPLWDFEDIGDNHRRVRVAGIAPLLAVPTTAGTGSEVGRAAVITDETARVKRTILHLRMMPRVAVLDPALTVGMPPALTAATGADALAHCLEAYCSPVFHPMAAAIAVEGMRLIGEYLPRAVADGRDLHAREQMLVASSMGAVAFQRGLGGVHALAQTLGALYDHHHGLLNAVIMPYMLQANRAALEQPMEHLARCLNLPISGFSGVMTWLLELRERIGIPECLGKIGIDDGDTDLIGRMSVQDGCARTNPIPFTAEDYSRIFLDAVHGRID